MKAHPSDIRDGIENSCIDPSLQKELLSQMIRNYRSGETAQLEMVWVDYILTTANSWKTPIKDFTLIIDRRKDSKHIAGAEMQYVSMCWNGPLNMLDPNHFIVHDTNFIPKKEIRVAFISFLGEPDK